MRPNNFVCGSGLIGKRRVFVGVDDFTVGAGHFDGAAVLKQSFIERQALIYKRAMLRLLDGSSGGGTIDLVLQMGRTYVPWVDGFFVMCKLLKIVSLGRNF